jgi:4-hydroxy-tetrahydrodipicolinate synthase
MASEVYKLSLGERRQIVEAVLEQADGRVEVIGGAGAKDRQVRSTVIADLLSIGCDHVLLQIPFECDDKYRADVQKIADLGVSTIMLQDWDSSGYGLPLPLICELFDEVDAFHCLKIEVVPAGAKYTDVLNATDGRLHVSGGWAVSQMLEGLARGVHAFMPTGMHKIYTTIYSEYHSGKIDEAEQLFQSLLPVLGFSNQHLDISIHFFKQLLFKQGVYATPNVRQPILPFDDVHQQMADELIERVIAIEGPIAHEV